MTAILQFVQGATTGPEGQSLFSSSLVSVRAQSAGDETDVEQFTFRLLDAPSDSSLGPLPLLLYQGSNNYVDFVPDEIGPYRVEMTLSDGTTTRKQIRVFVVTNRRGWIDMSYKSDGTEANFGGNTRGWGRTEEAFRADLLDNTFFLDEAHGASVGEVMQWDGNDWVPASVGGGGGGGGSGSQVIFSPSAAIVADNAFTTWSAVMVAAAAIPGVVQIVIGEDATIPSGTWALAGRMELIALFLGSALDLANGCVLRDATVFRGLNVRSYSASTVFSRSVLSFLNFRLYRTAFTPESTGRMFPAASATYITLLEGSSLNTGGSSGLIIVMSAGQMLRVEMHDNSSVADDCIGGDNGSTFSRYILSDFAYVGPQPTYMLGFTSTLARTQLLKDADIDPAAAIAGSKISPDFGNTVVQTTNVMIAGGFWGVTLDSPSGFPDILLIGHLTCTSIQLGHTGITTDHPGTLRLSALTTGLAHFGATGIVSSSLLVDADVDAAAAIAGTKIAPDFGSQNTTTTGSSTASGFIGATLDRAGTVSVGTVDATSVTIGKSGIDTRVYGTLKLIDYSPGIMKIDGSSVVGSDLLVDADVDSGANIAGSKIDPNFAGKQIIGDAHRFTANTSPDWFGAAQVDLTGLGTYTLLGTEYNKGLIAVEGVLPSNSEIVLPPVGIWMIANNTTGAYNLRIWPTGGGTGVGTIVQGKVLWVYGDGTDLHSFDFAVDPDFGDVTIRATAFAAPSGEPFCLGGQGFSIAGSGAYGTLAVGEIEGYTVVLVGALSGDRTVTFPVTSGGATWQVINRTTGAYLLTLLGGSGSIPLGPKQIKKVLADGTDLVDTDPESFTFDVVVSLIGNVGNNDISIGKFPDGCLVTLVVIVGEDAVVGGTSTLSMGTSSGGGQLLGSTPVAAPAPGVLIGDAIAERGSDFSATGRKHYPTGQTVYLRNTIASANITVGSVRVRILAVMP